MNWFSHLMFLLVVILTIFFEATFDGFRRLLGAQVDFLPCLLVYAGLTLGLEMLAATAVVGGLCFDSLSANPLGVSILPLFLVGLVAHAGRQVLLRDFVYARFMLGMAACAAAPLLTLALMSGLEAQPAAGWSFLWQWIVMSLLGGLATPLIFLLLDRMNRAWNYQPAPESSFRPDREIKRGR